MKDGHKISDRNSILAPWQVLVRDPFPWDAQDLLTVAQVELR